MIDINDLLKQYRMYHYRDDTLISGMRVNRLYGLNELIKDNLKETDMVCEVGSYAGVSSSLFAYYCRHVYCIDPFNKAYDGHDYEERFDNVAKIFGNITKIKGYSIPSSTLFDDNFFDFVYIDADHRYTYVKEDISTWIKKIKKGGFIGGHDYDSLTGKDVMKAVDEFFGKSAKIYEDSSWIVQL